jgi:hypothetical protein
MLNKEAEILHLFAKEPWRKYTFTELKKASGKTSKSYVEGVIKKFVKEGILSQESVSHLPLYSLNVSSAKARAFAGFVLEYFGWGRRGVPYADLRRIMDKCPYESYVFIVAGSYASGKQTGKSDIDVAILVEDACEPKKVYAELSHACELNIPPVHLYVFRHSEFGNMLFNKEANYGKEIAKNHLILAGGQTYVKLIGEAIENGFDGKRLAQ